MANQLSKTQVDKIGSLLKSAEPDAELLEALENYRSEFNEAYSHVERILTDKLLLKVTGRPAKSTLSIIEKLRRINSRLSQIQDIAGCRVVAPSLSEQNAIVDGCVQWFKDVSIDDKRNEPTHGYRAVHLIVKHEGKTVEIQVRTRIQHFWASMSEKLADEYGQEIKYGKGNPAIIDLLDKLSTEMSTFDRTADLRIRTASQAESARKSNSKNWKPLKRKVEEIDRAMRDSMYRTRSLLTELDEK